MAMSDIIADALIRIKNASFASHDVVYVPSNKLIINMMDIFQREGFIQHYSVVKNSVVPQLRIDLKYYQGKAVIRGVERVSKPGRRFYISSQNIVPTYNNIGLGIISTSKGVLTDKEAKLSGVGGEFICRVW